MSSVVITITLKPTAITLSHSQDNYQHQLSQSYPLIFPKIVLVISMHISLRIRTLILMHKCIPIKIKSQKKLVVQMDIYIHLHKDTQPTDFWCFSRYIRCPCTK